MTGTTQLPPTLSRLVSATNDHDIDALVACFAGDYTLVIPNHPSRNFTGTEQIRRNWVQFFSQIPDITVAVTRAGRSMTDPDEWWTEWEMRGTRRDGDRHLMRGVMIFTVGAEPTDLVRSNRFYVEPTDSASGEDSDAFVAELTQSATRS